ncbi:MAG: alpha/beta fold hydrolase [Betaproteobacteria bacterium]|nr:alpha/beta fold hydrolase [Betaproteobacteria bacterium]
MLRRLARLDALRFLLVSLCLVTGTSHAAEGFDRRLSEYAYPYPVSIFAFDSQRQHLEMAYMDVAPEKPNGETVLLLHGKNFSGAYWGSTIAALVALGYRVVVPDQIGFGKSSKPAAFQFTFQELARQTRLLLDARGVHSVHVVGHSMGGMLATRFALMYPEITRSLSLVNPIGLEDWKVKVPYTSVDVLYQHELAKTPESVKAYMQKVYFGGSWKPDYDPLLDIAVGWLRGPDYPAIAWDSALTYDMLFTQPVVYEFPDIRVPTLLIIGQRDRTAPGRNLVPREVAETIGHYPELGRAAARAIPGARLVELDGVGHVPQFEAFDRYIAALTGFLRSRIGR